MANTSRDLDEPGVDLQPPPLSNGPTKPTAPWSFRGAIGKLMVDIVDWGEDNRRMLAAGSVLATAGAFAGVTTQRVRGCWVCVLRHE